MKSHSLKAGAIALTCGAFLSAVAIAAPPAGSPYQTDPQQSYVEDATSQGIGQVNMIACIMSAMRPDALVNEGSYVALIDENKCDQDKRGGSGDAAQGAASYITATVNSSRASNSDPMIAKMWLELDEEGMHTTIYVRISATEAPSTANPYGVFRLDFCGLANDDSTCEMNGFVEGTADGLRYYQVESDGNQSNTVAMRLATVGTTSGSGRMLMDGGQNQAEFSFAYNQGLFLRSDGTDDQCFSRDASDPETGLSVWRYGLYDGLTGERITRSSGFPIEYTAGGTKYQGYLGYFGLSLPPDAANALHNGDTVEKVDYSAGDTPTRTSYTAVRAGGKLVKYSKKSRTLAEIDHVKFSTFVGNDANSFFAGAQPNVSYEMYWDDTIKQFRVTGQMQCGSQGCQTVDLDQEEIVGVSYWSARGGIQGSSQSLGGELFINLGGLVDPVASAAVAVVYRTQDLVYPSQLPATLYCVQNCPTADTLSDYFAPGSVAQSPYTSATYNSFSSTLLANVVTYGTDAASATLRDGVNEEVVFTDAEGYGQHPFYQYGVRSGRLVEDLAAVECASNSGTYCDWKASSLEVYYQWETGPNAWNQFTGVKNGSGDFVAFDPPLQVTFNVPDTAAFGESAGSSIVLQYGGFGELWGIPGHCVSRLTNEEVSCVEQESRYVPAFVIPADEAVGHVADGSNTYLVKWLNREIRFAKKDVTNYCSAQGLTAPAGVILPTAADLRNPSSASSDIYIGTKPVVTSAPRVIHGEVKY